jgi:hypothetical protein
LGGTVVSALVFFADSDFLGLYLSHFDLAVMLLYRKREKQNHHCESKEKECDNVMVTRNEKATLHDIRENVVNKAHFLPFT